MGNKFNDYEQVIIDTYLSGIKNTLIIDDEFPTFLELAENSKNDSKDYTRAVELYKFFRDKGWTCDVENTICSSSDYQSNIIPNLQHSDLLILDYHLMPGDDSNPSLALEAIKDLSNSPFF